MGDGRVDWALPTGRGCLGALQQPRLRALLPSILALGGCKAPICDTAIRRHMAAGTLTPEQKARVRIDAGLLASGWLVQDRPTSTSAFCALPASRPPGPQGNVDAREPRWAVARLRLRRDHRPRQGEAGAVPVVGGEPGGLGEPAWASFVGAGGRRRPTGGVGEDSGYLGGFAGPGQGNRSRSMNYKFAATKEIQ